MDKQLLSAFHNLSIALEQISDALNKEKDKKESSTSSIIDALKNSDIGTQIKSIDTGIKKIQSENKEIISNQKKILVELSKKSIQKPITKIDRPQITTIPLIQKPIPQKITKPKIENKNIFEYKADQSQQKNIKDGVKIILLIASGIIAIGLAFKLIGSVDFKSVIAMSIALPLLALAFEKISNIKLDAKSLSLNILGLILIAGSIVSISLILGLVKPISTSKVLTVIFIASAFAVLSPIVSKISDGIKNIDMKNLWKLPLILVTSSMAILSSSWILSLVKPVGILQLATAVFIAGSFVLLSPSIAGISNSIKNIDAKNLWKLPIILVAASAAIMTSSWILQYVKPVGILQLLTTIFIAGAFAVLSISLGKLTKGISGIDTKDLWKLPIVLIAASTSIMLSSWILQSVRPVGFWQLLTAIGISAAFVVLSFGLPKLAESVRKVGIADATLMPIILVALSASILGSSFLLSQVQVIPINTLINIALQAATLSIIGITLGLAIGVMSKFGLGSGTKMVQNVTFGSISLLIVATTIMASSWILSIGNYGNYPDLSWTIGVATSMLAFGVGIVAIGSLISLSAGLGLGALILGGIGMSIIAATILATATILGSGDYRKYPSWEWSTSVGLSLVAFGSAMIAGGFGIIALSIGYFSIKLIANAIVDTARILSTGKFTGGPSLAWSIGTGVLLTSFGAVMIGLGAFVGGTLGLGYLALKAGSNAIKLVSQSIVDSSFILSKGSYKNGPNREWSQGVGLSIAAFAPVYNTLTSKGILGAIFGGGGSSPQKMKQAIITISEGIVAAAEFFSGKSIAFKNGPSVEWAEGVGKSIGAFAPVYKILGSNGIFSIFTGGNATPDEMVSAIKAISYGVIESAQIFGKNSTAFNGSYPSVEWSEGIGSAISAFGPAFKWANDNSSWFGAETSFLQRTITTIAKSIVDVANILSGKYDGNKYGTPSYINPIPIGYAQTLSNIYESFFDIVNNKNVQNVEFDDLSKISNIAKSISDNSNILSTGNYKPIPIDYMNNLSSNVMAYTKLISYLKGNVYEETLFGFTTGISSDISRMASDYDKLSKSIKNLSGSIESINIEKISALKTLTGSIVLMSLMDSDQFESMMDSLESKTKIFVDVIKNIEDGSKGSEISIKTSVQKESGPSISDVLNIMNRIDYRLSQLVSSNANLSSYVNEIRSGNASIKKNR